MPSMRELLKDIRCGGSDFVGPFTYGLFEKLVEALEPEDTPTDEEYNDVRDTRICQLQKQLAEAKAERDSWERQYRTSEDARGRALRERNGAKAEIESLKAGHDDWETRCLETEDELAEAQTEIEELRESRRWWKQRCKNAGRDVTRLRGITSAQGPRIEELETEIKLLRKERDSAELKLETLKAIDKRILADAEVGRLVRDMPDGTALQHTGRQYYAMRCSRSPAGFRAIASSCATNPAEALRVLQQEKPCD